MSVFGSKCHVFVQKLWKGMTGVRMIILQSDQDLILGLSLPMVARQTRGPLVPGKMAGVQVRRRTRHLPDLRALEARITVLQGLVRGHTVHADYPSKHVKYRYWRITSTF